MIARLAFYRPLLTAVFLCLTASAVAQDDAQDDWARAKGIYLDRTGVAHSRQAAQFSVVLPASGERASTEHQFYSGDRLRFQFTLKRPAYVYVLNSTIPSDDPAELHLARGKGIVRVREGRPAGLPVAFGPWRVLLPLSATEAKKIPEGITSDGALFMMDEQSGLEILSIVVAPSPLDIERVSAETAVSEDTRENALANIRDGSLAMWAANCDVSLAPAGGYLPTSAKGIQLAEKESYVVARDSERPFAFQVSLQHLLRRPL